MHVYLVLYLSLLFSNILIPGLIGLFLFLTTYRTNPTVRGFANLSFAIVFWAIFNFLSLLSQYPEQASLLVSVSYFGLIFTPVFFVELSSSFADQIAGTSYRRHLHIFQKIALLLAGANLLDIFFGTNFILGSLKDVLWTQNWPIPGSLFEIFLIYYSASFTVGNIWLVKARKRANALYQKQIDYIVWPSVAAAVGGGSMFSILYDLPFTMPPVGGFIIPIYAIFLFYAITRFHLFNLKVVTAELSTIIIWLLLFGRILIDQDLIQRSFDIGLFVLSVFFGFLTIRSVLTEMKQKESLDEANRKLTDLNTHLEDRVRGQTVEIRKAYEVEKRARIDIEELDKTKDQFILTTQHHLRTPLTVIKGFVDLLKTGEKNLSPEGTHALSKIDEASKQMAGMVNDFLDIAQHEVGKASFERAPVSLWQILKDIQDELSSELERKKIRFETDFSGEAQNTFVYADKSIKHAIFNLIDNAVKYTQEGRISVHGSVLIHPIEKTKIFRLEVSDTGIGLTQGEISKMFKRYFERGEEARKINTTGKGIGLAITKNTIENHGGKISASSEGRGLGTTFVVELPINRKEY